jgi:hypothetical protein
MPLDAPAPSETAASSPESGSRVTKSTSSTFTAPPLSMRSSAPTNCPSNRAPGPNV